MAQKSRADSSSPPVVAYLQLALAMMITGSHVVRRQSCPFWAASCCSVWSHFIGLGLVLAGNALAVGIVRKKIKLV